MKLSQKPQHQDKCKFNRVRLNLIWYHFILNLEIRAWNLYFVKICSDKLAAMLVRRYSSSVFRLCYPNRFIRCMYIYICGRKTTSKLHYKPVSWLLTLQGILLMKWKCSLLVFFSSYNILRSTFMYWALFYKSQILHFIYIYLKLNEETNMLERKATLNFCFGKTKTSTQAGTELWRNALLFLYLLELFNRGKRWISWLFCKVNSLKSFFKPWESMGIPI